MQRLLILIGIVVCKMLPLGVFAASQPPWGNGTHFCGVIDCQPSKQRSAQYRNRYYARTFASNLNVGEPRTVRMIYFLPNDRPYRADEVQWIKDEIHKVQTFYAEQMSEHGYGNKTFRFETDAEGEPLVHHMDGQRSNSHYVTNSYSAVEEIARVFDLSANIYHIILDAEDFRGHGGWRGKNAGYSLLPGRYGWGTVGHELGHAFGLSHDFSNGRYIMSYGPGMDRLSACHAKFLSVHPYFNPDIPLEEAPPPTIELISPRGYAAGTERVTIRLKVRDSEGLHQVVLFVRTVEIHSAGGGLEVKAYRGFEGEKEGVVEFDYDGVIPSDDRTSLSSALTHPIIVQVVDTDMNVGWTNFVLFSEALERVSKISGDNQHGLPNTELPVPFVVQVRDLNDGFLRYGVPVTFTVTAGDGTLNIEQTATDRSGRARSWLTLGPNLGANTVKVSAAGMTVIFNAVAGAAVDIPDRHLRAAIETKLRVASGTPISPADIASLNTLVVRGANIHNLTGLEHATNIATLFLGGNNISDISPLAGLTNLRDLELGGNVIVDISPVAGLTSLTLLHFAGSRVPDISPVAGLKRLTLLNLGGNNISDLSVLAGLTNLTWLGLWHNHISDLSPLASLTNLTYLYLVDNNISDLSPLLLYTGLGNGGEVDVKGNPLSYQSIHTHIPALQKRGVDVTFDSRTPQRIRIVSGNDQKSLPGAALEKLLVVEVQDENRVAFEGVPVTFTVTAGDGTLSTTRTATDANGQAQSTLKLGSISETNTVSVAAADIEQPITINTGPIDIADANLRARIEAALGKTSGASIDKADMAALTHLEAKNANINDLTGLESATNLTHLTLSDEYVEAERRWINSNSVSDLSPLSGLTNLTELWLQRNNISDISALAGLTRLRHLSLGTNNISEISALTGLTNLTYLSLEGNSVADVSAVAGLTNLTELILGGNSITDISSVAGLTNLTGLHLPGNSISDISAVEGLTQLSWLYLAGNSITDISPLVANKGLGSGDVVHMTEIRLNYASIYTHIPALQTRGVKVTFDSRTPRRIRIVSGDDQQGLPGAALEKLLVVEVQDEKRVAFEGVPVTFTVTAGGGSLSAASVATDSNGRAESTLTLGPNPGTNTVEVTVTGIEEKQTFNAEGIQSVKMSMFALSIPAGTHAIHIPLKVSQINGEDGTIETVGDLYDALGDAVNFIIPFIGGQPVIYLDDESAGAVEDAAIGDDTGLIVSMKHAATLELMGEALGTGGTSTVNINVGRNLVGVPLDPSGGLMISDLLLVEGVVAIAVSTAAGDGFHTITAAGQDGDGPLMGGVGYIVVASAARSIPIAGSAWENSGSSTAAPAIAFNGSQTPVLHVKGGVMDEFDMLSRIPELRVTVRNLSTGASIDTVLGTEQSAVAYSGIFVEFSRRAAQAGDVLGIAAHSPNPYVGVRPVPRIVVSAEEVLTSRMKLPDLELYEIPSETELLANYPNPFNPETWIPYRLAMAAEVALEIYDTNGSLVRSIDVGFKPAAVYESRASAIYWDGRNDNGESVASGLYFYQLATPSYRQLRRMVIVK